MLPLESTERATKSVVPSVETVTGPVYFVHGWSARRRACRRTPTRRPHRCCRRADTMTVTLSLYQSSTPRRDVVARDRRRRRGRVRVVRPGGEERAGRLRLAARVRVEVVERADVRRREHDVVGGVVVPMAVDVRRAHLLELGVEVDVALLHACATIDVGRVVEVGLASIDWQMLAAPQVSWARKLLCSVFHSCQMFGIDETTIRASGSPVLRTCSSPCVELRAEGRRPGHRRLRGRADVVGAEQDQHGVRLVGRADRVRSPGRARFVIFAPVTASLPPAVPLVRAARAPPRGSAP